MSAKIKSFRSPLGTARVLGSAKSGTEHWIAERVSALIMVPLAFYLLFGFLNKVVAGGYSGAMYWLQSPVSSGFVILFLLAALRHVTAGLQVVMEDYIGPQAVRLTMIFTVQFAAAAFAIIGTLSVARIFLGV